MIANLWCIQLELELSDWPEDPEIIITATLEPNTLGYSPIPITADAITATYPAETYVYDAIEDARDRYWDQVSNDAGSNADEGVDAYREGFCA